MVNKKNKIFVIFLIVIGFLIFFFTCSFFAKYKEWDNSRDLKQYKKLANSVVSTKVLEAAAKKCVTSFDSEKKIDFVTLISLLAAKYDGNWKKFKEKDLEEYADKLNSGEKEEELAKIYNKYHYFKNFYDVLFCELIGKYKISKEVKKNVTPFFEKKFGIKAYSPIAYGYFCNFCDDFDNEVNFAKQKGHFGNDITVKKCTPFVAIESGIISKYVKETDCNRIEIKSFDGRRTYIYLFCDDEKKLKKEFKEGDIIAGGQVLGLIGNSNCCKKGGANILKCPYLHLGLKLKIKTKDEKEVEVYVDLHNILQFLEHHKSALIKTKDGFTPKYIFKDKLYENYYEKQS